MRVGPPNLRLQRTPLRLPLSRKPLGGRRILLGAAALLGVLLGFVRTAEAKCGSLKYTIRAEVRDRSTLTPIPGAILTFFANDEGEAWLIDWCESDPARYTTDARGQFDGDFNFGTASGSFFGIDRCNKKLKKLTVVITAQGHSGRRVTFKPSEFTKSGDEFWKATLQLPPITLGGCR